MLHVFSKHTWFSRICSLGYAIPGTVLAIGLMLALGKIDHAIADFLEFKLGIHTGLLFLGTSFTLIYAYAVRFLANFQLVALSQAITVFMVFLMMLHVI